MAAKASASLALAVTCVRHTSGCTTAGHVLTGSTNTLEENGVTGHGHAASSLAMLR
jgi:hypothetical protein